MATKTIHDFTAVTSLAGTDEILAWIVGSNTTRKITWANALTNATLVTPTIVSFANAQHNHQSAAGGGTLDHGAALTGLSDDDHTQYLLATGTRTGATSQAQTFANGINGSTVANGDISIRGTSHATKTTSYVLLQEDGGLVGIGTTTPDVSLAIESTNTRLKITNTSTSASSSTGFTLRNSEADDTTGQTEWHFFVQKDSAGAATGTSTMQIRKRNTAQSEAITILRTDASNNLILLSGFTAGSAMTPGYVAVGTSNPTALLYVGASTTTRASLRLVAGSRPTTPNTSDIWDDGALVSYHINSTTNAVVNSLKLERGSSGTPAAGFGLGIVAQLESSTTDTQDAGRLTWAWSTATHASRAAVGSLTAYYTSTERTIISWVADSTSGMVGINNSTPSYTLDGLAPGGGAANIFRFGQSGVSNGFTLSSDGATLTYALIGGKIGLGITSPQSLLHGHDGTGGFMFVNRAAVDGTLVTVIPNGTGDVTENLSYFGYVKHSGGYTGTVAEGDLSPANYTIVSNAGNELTFGVASDGSFTLQRTAGTGTWNVCLWVIWR